jgi:hypothetical protein
MKIGTIHASLVNGQRRQMAEQIDEYGVYDFWQDYKNHLLNNFSYADALEAAGRSSMFEYFTDAVISYHRIKNR